jgi:hypothetical protein
MEGFDDLEREECPNLAARNPVQAEKPSVERK